jgi:hypothetical protein
MFVCAQQPLSGQHQNMPDTYASWLIQSSSKYDHQEFLGDNEEFALHWKIDQHQINMAVAVGTMGWVGFGISETGGMKGADMFLYTAADNALVDAFSTDYMRPFEDTCQDWQLQNATLGILEDFMIVEVSRPLKTGDRQDLDFHDDADTSVPSHRVISAWGEQAHVSFHGDNVGLKMVRFFAASVIDHPTAAVVEKELATLDSSKEFSQPLNDGEL